MKSALGVALALALVTTAIRDADTASPAGGLQSYEVSWSIPTNNWPEKLWVYKTVSQEFSAPVISNVLALASFTTADLTDTPDYLLRKDKATRFFGILEGTCRHLAVCPGLGYIEYHDGKAIGPITSATKGTIEPVVGVPGQEETTRLGLKYLRLLGIDASQLATKTGSGDLDLHWERGTTSYFSEKTGTRVEETNSFGVYFNRRIDGLNVAGIGYHGGVYLSFGNHCKIADLRVTWRNLQPYQLHDCPSPEQVVRWIRSGRIALRANRGGLRDPLLNLTVFKATFVYEGELGDRPMDLVFPYAILEATAASASTTNFVSFDAPMTLSEGNWRVAR